MLWYRGRPFCCCCLSLPFDACNDLGYHRLHLTHHRAARRSFLGSCHSTRLPRCPHAAIPFLIGDLPCCRLSSHMRRRMRRGSTSCAGQHRHRGEGGAPCIGSGGGAGVPCSAGGGRGGARNFCHRGEVQLTNGTLEPSRASPSPRARLATRRSLSGREPHGSHARRALHLLQSLLCSFLIHVAIAYR